MRESDQAGKLLAADFLNLGQADTVIRDCIAYRKAVKDGMAVMDSTDTIVS